MKTYATTSADGYLYGVSAGLTDLLQVQRTMCVFVLAPVNFEWRRVSRDLDTRRPIRVHLTILMMETFELQFEIRPTHECVVDGWLKLKYMITNG